MKDQKNTLFLDKDDITSSFETFKSFISSDFDRLTIIIHLIMEHSGLKFKKLNQEVSAIELTTGSFYNKLTYNWFETKSKSFKFEHNIIITLINSGSKTIDINLKHIRFNSLFVKVSLAEFFSADLNSKLIELTNMFKDKVLNPFKLSYKDEKLIIGIVDLPVEILFRLALNYLDIKGLVSLMQTCTFFKDIFDNDRTSCNSLWYGLFKRDWDKYDSLRRDWVESSSINFRNDYIKNYKRKKRNNDPFYKTTRSFQNF